MRAPENEIDPLLHPTQVAKLLHRGWPSLASTALGPGWPCQIAVAIRPFARPGRIHAACCEASRSPYL